MLSMEHGFLQDEETLLVKRDAVILLVSPVSEVDASIIQLVLNDDNCKSSSSSCLCHASGLVLLCTASSLFFERW